jgi:mono/diheme cytochrome c family protein
MKSCLLLAALIMFACARPGTARAQSGAQSPDIGREALSVFAAKCAVCHGPELVKPKGRFGYVLDLRRIAGNPEMVVPPHTDESELWMLVQHDEMPPADSPQGPLTAAQKEIIRTWIAAGAPEPSGTIDSPELDSAEWEATTSLATIDRLLRWVGKFHLLMIHFPIALIFAAGLGEGWSIWRRSLVPSNVVRFCLWIAALAAVPTVVLGWLYAAGGNGASSPLLLLAHRWLGTTAAGWLVFLATCSERDARHGARSWTVWFLLAAGIGFTAITAHFGGLLAHGADFVSY